MNSDKELAAMKQLPTDVVLAITDIDREIARRNSSQFQGQGGMLKMTETQYRAMREYILANGAR